MVTEESGVSTHTKKSLRELGQWIRERKTMEKRKKNKTKSVTVDKATGWSDEIYCEMYKCPVCAETIEEGSNYCPGCGRKIRWKEAPAKEPEPPSEEDCNGDPCMQPAPPPVGKP